MSKYLVFISVSLSLLLASISGTAIAVAFPVITESFDTSLVVAGWVLSVYQLVATAAMPLVGKATDILGKKPVFLLCLSLFTVGSLLCALAPNIELLIVFRFIQGAGGGGFLPSAAGIVAEAFPKSRQRFIGLFSSVFPMGQIIGPNVGGWLVSSYGWRSIFWFNVPLAAITLILAAILLRSGEREKGRLDLQGVGLFSGSLFALMTGLTQIGNSDTALALASCVALLAASAVLIVLFVRHVNKTPEPIIDREVLRQKPFLAANIFNFIFGGALFGIISFVPLYTVSLYGMTILQSGLILTARSVGMMLTSILTSVFLVRWGYRRPMLVGTALIVLSLALLGTEAPGINLPGLHLDSTTWLVVVMLLSGLGTGIAAPAANNACIELMPNRVASITGVRGMFRQSGGVISISVVSLLLENIDMARGFSIAFFGLGIVLLVASPLIFAMPKSPEAPRLVESAAL